MTQNNSIRNLINSFGRIISFFSNDLDLTPGTVIITRGQDKSLGGKGFIPPGCLAAHYLRPGDEVRSVVQGVGEIVFRAD
jgi:2-keto-4-pentenoate hydratase/2-oxohepta-3-ene-1,7-dioic acid hydratase in catechol pathway